MFINYHSQQNQGLILANQCLFNDNEKQCLIVDNKITGTKSNNPNHITFVAES